MSTTITIDGSRYQVGKLNALQQFHLARRLAPVLATMGVSMAQLKAGSNLDLSDFTEMLGPVAEVLAKMSDADANYIIHTSLSVVSREQGSDRWAPVCVSGNMMFVDIEMPAMLRMVVETLQVNLLNFLAEPSDVTTSPSSLAAGRQDLPTSG